MSETFVPYNPSAAELEIDPADLGYKYEYQVVDDMVFTYRDLPEMDPALRWGERLDEMPSTGANSSEGLYSAQAKAYPLLNGREEEIELASAIEEGKYAFLRLQKGGLSRKEAHAAEAAAIAGTKAFLNFYEANLRLVFTTVNRYRVPNGFERIDLISFGNFGLARAVAKFDHRKGFKFSTYAVGWIKQSVDRFLDDEQGLVRLSADMHDRIRQLEKTKRYFLEDRAREATDADLLEMGYDAEFLETAYRFGSDIAISSLDTPLELGDDEASRHEFVKAPDNTEEDALLTNLNEVDSMAASFFAWDGISSQTAALTALRFGIHTQRAEEYLALNPEHRSEYKRVLSEIGKTSDLASYATLGRVFGLTPEVARKLIVEGINNYALDSAVNALVQHANLDEAESRLARQHFLGRPSRGRETKSYTANSNKLFNILEAVYGEELADAIDKAVCNHDEPSIKLERALWYRFGLSRNGYAGRHKLARKFEVSAADLHVLESRTLEILTGSQPLDLVS